MRFLQLSLSSGVLACAIAVTSLTAAEPVADEAALERTRNKVKMLDDIYKTAVVLVTENYVEDDDDLPAGAAFKKLFEAVEKKGWHSVRLLDATGDPYEPSNAPKKGFEQRAVKKLLDGEAWYEETGMKDGKPVMMVATPIPVIMKKCTLCHEHY
ncbi:MAG: DUF3365 domain-containing protein, partial [Planctomycetaceae bacterium]|nr:DUF3365 domain-containing protein [Planctomycetaceae bacterium]